LKKSTAQITAQRIEDRSQPVAKPGMNSGYAAKPTGGEAANKQFCR
jgi:hypothetical protein